MDASPDSPAVTESPSRRESDVLQLIGRGLTNKEIARELNLSVATVKHHVHNLLGKLNLPPASAGYATGAGYALDRFVMVGDDAKKIALSA